MAGLCSATIFPRYLAAAVAITLYSEWMARIRRCPVTSYLIVALLPLVPGGGIYYAMRYSLSGDNQQFLATLLTVFGIAGTLALGALLASSVVRLFITFAHRTRK